MSSSRRSRVSVWWWELSYRIGPNLWLVPLFMSVGSVVLFLLTRWVDRNVLDAPLPDLFRPASTADAAIVLTALLGAVATALALVFSTSILTFSIASSQLGPRLIRRFMSDPITQVTLGAFMATLIFLVLTLSAVRTGFRDGLPQLSVVVAILGSLACFGMLVFYVHRVASTIQAPNVVASVVADLRGVLAELDGYLPAVATPGARDAVDAAVRTARDAGREVLAPRSGYVELLDHPRLLDAADGDGAVIVLDRRPGQFVVQGQVMARVLPRDVPDRVCRVVAEAVEIGNGRTLRQDIEFALAQVVEIALRALSPALNDTYTGLTCIDWLSAAMVQIGRHPEPSGGWCGDDGTLRLVEPPLHFERELKAAFDLIRQSGAQNPAVLIRLLDGVITMAAMVHVDRLPALRDHAELVHETATGSTFVSGDLRDFSERYDQALAVIDARLASV